MKEVKEVVPAHEKIYYLAEDGKAFNSKEDCLSWENKLLAEKIFKDRHYVINGYEKEYDNYPLVGREHWFIIGNEATPELLISYISYTMRIFLSEYRKKYILNYCKKDHSLETVNGNYLLGIIFTMDNCGDVENIEFLSIVNAQKRNEELMDFYKDKKMQYEDLILNLGLLSNYITLS